MKSFKKYVSEGKQGALAGAGVNPHAQGFQMDSRKYFELFCNITSVRIILRVY